VVDRALAHPAVRRALVPVVFGDGPTFERLATLRRLPAVDSGSALPPEGPVRVAVTELGAKDRIPGKPTRSGGKAQLAYVTAAVAAALRGEVDALCTAPVSKEQISRAGVRFIGHTELLAESFGREVLMLMDGPRVKVALATNHVAIRDLPRALEKRRLAAQLQLLSASLQPVLGRRPRIAVCGLNPHAGEGGLLGDEEIRTIAPAIALARRRGVDCTGPWPADGLFSRPDHMPADVVLAMFHDQALVVAKALDFDRTVNVTLGLPVPRTSPDHGVAYALAGKGKASAEPMVAALLKAAQLAAPRGRVSARASTPRPRA
jgi:4-hydroxythreonine-4-phosphate dehydrogenase